jgi:type IV pilus assembly protein PilQ
MHAFSTTRQDGIRRDVRRRSAALLLNLACLGVFQQEPAVRAQQLSPPSSMPQAAAPRIPVPIQNPQAPPLTGPNVMRPEDILAAAAKAAGIVQTPAPLEATDPNAPGTSAAGSGQLPRQNPFAVKIGEMPRDLVIPANPADAERVVVKEKDGQISLLVREGSLRQVVSMIAETQKLNIVFAGASDTVVTASFDRQPWRTVLDALLSASGHAWTTQQNIIFVSSVENASFLTPGTEGRKVMVYELDFASAMDLDATVKGLLSPAGESWVTETSPSDNRRTREVIAVVDYPQHLDRISEYISQADQPPRQVYIEAHILQVELSDECRNGINFENLASLSSSTINLRSVGFANAAGSPAFFVEPNGQGADGVGLKGLIELLQATQDVKTLATPKIHSVSGQESHIQIGDKLGYKVTTTTQTSSLESVQMLEVGVVLRVTPRVTRDGRVLMRILPKVSTGSVSPEGLPNEKTTEVETDILLNSGQGMVLGGLIQETDSNIQSKLPFLGDIPYLGVLFQKRTVVKSRREIIVTLQPHVLPYCPIVQEQHDHEFMRTTQPLTQGAIKSFPRPYEPSMPDALEKDKHVKHLPSRWTDAPVEHAQLVTLPAVEPHLEYPPAVGVTQAPYEELPAPEDFNAP